MGFGKINYCSLGKNTSCHCNGSYIRLQILANKTPLCFFMQNLTLFLVSSIPIILMRNRDLFAVLKIVTVSAWWLFLKCQGLVCSLTFLTARWHYAIEVLRAILPMMKIQMFIRSQATLVQSHMLMYHICQRTNSNKNERCQKYIKETTNLHEKGPWIAALPFLAHKMISKVIYFLGLAAILVRGTRVEDI